MYLFKYKCIYTYTKPTHRYRAPEFWFEPSLCGVCMLSQQKQRIDPNQTLTSI